MKIENLKYFLTVVRVGSIHKAAEELYLTPQNLSTIIKNIEHDVGEELLIRTSKGVALSAEGERFLPYAQTIEHTYQEYFASKKLTSKTLDFYTTPTLSIDLTELQGLVFYERYYLSMQRRSVNDLRNMIQKRVPGIYLMMVEHEKLEKVGSSNYTLILQSKENIKVCHKDNPILIDKTEEQDQVVIMQDHYSKKYRECLYMNDLIQIKSLLRKEIAVYHCMDYQYNKHFRDETDWTILQRWEIPTYDMIMIFVGSYEDKLKQRIEQIVRSNYAENEDAQ